MIVNVRVDIPPTAMVEGLKDLLIEGGATTVMVAVLLVLPVPPSVELIVPVVLLWSPAVAPVTGTLKLQLAPGLAIDAPVSVILPVEFTVVSVPLQVAVGPESATVNPEGSVSVKVIPVRGLPFGLFGLCIVKFRFTKPPSGTVEEAKDFETEGGLTMFNCALLLANPVPPFVELTALVMLKKVPNDVGVTVTLNVHGLPGATCAPLRLILCVALVTVSVPLQTVVLASVTVNVESNVSVKATPVKVVAAFGLVIVKLT